MKICFVVTDSMNLWSLYKLQLEYLKAAGFSVTMVASAGTEHDGIRARGFDSVEIQMQRAPSPLKDIISIIRLFKFFRTERFDLVCFSTPKASLLASIAAYCAGVKSRVFMVRGRVYENKKGLPKYIYTLIDKVICALSTGVLSISREIILDYIKKNICPEGKVTLISSGSSNGVDVERFNPSEIKYNESLIFRREILKDADAVLLMYSGRFKKEKGLEELIHIFSDLRAHYNIELLLVGKPDKLDEISQNTLSYIENCPLVHVIDWTDYIEKYLIASDIFIFPSHREGFGNVVIEASACGLPVIGFDVIGVRESVNDGHTGILVPFLDIAVFKEKLSMLIESKEQRKLLGDNGREWVLENFKDRVVWDFLIDYYRSQAK